MRINRLIIKNFRNHASLDLSPSDITKIIGRNGRGKTTIGEALVWVFTGMDTTGKTAQDKRLMKAGEKEMYVGVEVVFDTGVKKRIERMKSGDKSTDLKMDGKRSGQEALNVHLKDADVFLSAFWPGYFGSLEPKKAREILMGLLPPLSPHAVADHCLAPDDAALVKTYEESQLLGALDKLMQDLRKDIADTAAEIQKLEGKLEEAKTLSTQTLLPMPADVDHKAKIADLEAQIVAIRAGSKKAEIQTKIAELQGKLAELRNDKERVSLQHEVNSLQQQMQSLLRELDLLKSQKKPVPSTSCPTCKQPLPEAQAKKLIDEANAFNQQLAKKYKAVQMKGAALKKEHQAKQDFLAKLPDTQKQIKAIVDEIGVLQKVLATSVDEDRMKELQAELAKLRQEEQQYLIAVNEIKVKNKQIEDARARAAKMLDELDEKRLLHQNLTQTLSALGQYRTSYAEQQILPLTRHLKRAEIQLYQVVQSTGEMKPSFNVYWTNDEGLKVPYRSLSTSEKIRCDLEISAMISAVTGETYPVFVDNAEAVNYLEKENILGQLFAAYAVEDVELKITSEPRVAVV